MTVIKPQSPFERLKNANSSAEVALRKAIILQAIIDASSLPTSAEMRKLAQDAKEWLFGNSADFNLICHEAGMHPAYVVKISRAMVTLHHNKQLKEVRSGIKLGKVQQKASTQYPIKKARYMV